MGQMNYTTYLFDFDYKLADSSCGIILCFRNVLLRHNYTNVTDDAIKRTIGKTLEDVYKRQAKNAAVDLDGRILPKHFPLEIGILPEKITLIIPN